jgi:hypothetical protein
MLALMLPYFPKHRHRIIRMTNDYMKELCVVWSHFTPAYVKGGGVCDDEEDLMRLHISYHRMTGQCSRLHQQARTPPVISSFIGGWSGIPPHAASQAAHPMTHVELHIQELHIPEQHIPQHVSTVPRPPVMTCLR